MPLLSPVLPSLALSLGTSVAKYWSYVVDIDLISLF